MAPSRRSLFSLPIYVPGKPAEALERELGISGALKLASNENPLGPSKKGMNALKNGIREIARYPDGGAFLLRQAIADRLHVSPDQVILGNGSDEILSLITRAFIFPGDEAIMADPSFAIYRLTTLASHGKPIVVPLTSWAQGGRHDLARMAQAVTKKTRVVFICNPNNPTGTIVRHDEVVRFLALIPKSVCVVLDEAYAEYATDSGYPKSVELLRKGHPIIFLRTFSKIYGLAGLRVGYGIGPARWIDLFNRIRSPFNVNHLAQKAALEALSDEAHVEQSVRVNERAKAYLDQQFAKMGIDALPSQANFICFRLFGTQRGKRKEDSFAKEVYEALLRHGVIIRHMGGPHLRVTLGTPAQMKRFVAALSQVLQTVGSA